MINISSNKQYLHLQQIQIDIQGHLCVFALSRLGRKKFWSGDMQGNFFSMKFIKVEGVNNIRMLFFRDKIIFQNDFKKLISGVKRVFSQSVERGQTNNFLKDGLINTLFMVILHIIYIELRYFICCYAGQPNFTPVMCIRYQTQLYKSLLGSPTTLGLGP